MNVEKFLQEQRVAYDLIPHRDTYDAQHLAQTVHTPGKEVAKTVLLRADGGYAYLVAVLPATKRIDFERLGALLGGSRIELATEVEMYNRCLDCEIGALPPFGSHYAMKTVVDSSLAERKEIVFEGNTHHEAIRMRYDDFYRLEQPIVTSFAIDAVDGEGPVTPPATAGNA